MQSRVEIFRCVAQVPQLRDTERCARCLCAWIVDGAAAQDAAMVLAAPMSHIYSGILPVADNQVEGLAELCQRARLSVVAGAALQRELLSWGVVDVRELAATDWTKSGTWSGLKVFEQRRLWAILGGA